MDTWCKGSRNNKLNKLKAEAKIMQGFVQEQ